MKALSFIPVLVAGEKKLKTGEKMVPRRVVRGGLPVASTGTSSLPLGLIGLLLQVIVSESKQKRSTYFPYCAFFFSIMAYESLLCSDDSHR